MEETKEADPSIINVDNVMESANSCGDAGHGGKRQAITQTQRNILSTTENWDAEILNCVLVHVLDEHMMEANVVLVWPAWGRVICPGGQEQSETVLVA